MANTSAARGLWPVRKTSGQPWSGAANIYHMPASDTSNRFLGDPVLPTGSSDANGIPQVGIATAGATNYILGPIVGIVNSPIGNIPVTRDMPTYRQASTSQYVLVADDPELVFWMQEDGVGGAIGVAGSMANADIIAGSGSTVTGLSGWLLDSNTAGTGATKQVRILRPWDVSDNDPTLTLAKWLVRINLHSLTNPAGV